jgi:hypothetical protein
MTILTAKGAKRDARHPDQIRAAKTLYGDAVTSGGLSEGVAHTILSPIYSGRERAAGLRGDKIGAARIAAEHATFAKAAVELNVSEPTLRQLTGELEDHLGSFERRDAVQSSHPRDVANRAARAQVVAEAQAAMPQRTREALQIRFGADADQALARAKAAAAALDRRVPGFFAVLDDSGAGNDAKVIEHLAEIGAGLGK